MASENGWEPAKARADQCQWVVVPGTDVSLQLLKGQPATILRAYAADYHAYVEPLRDADSAGWTPTNSVATSNHLNGTAVDLNWGSHPFRVSYAGYTPAMIATMRELLDFYEDTMFWAQDWETPKDAMHHQLGYGTYNNPKTADFIARKIRTDGYSTFRRGDTEPPTDAATVLARATGLTATRAAEILPQVRDGLDASECTTPLRIAMWLAQIGHESDNFNATEEYQSGDIGQDRWKYKGRTWIQITWRANYLGFSRWCHGRGLVPTTTYFVDHPRELAEQKWAGLGPAWYWTVARPRINEMCDGGDLYGVTTAINGGLNGLPDRNARYVRARALGDDLLALVSATPTDPIEELLMSSVPSLSIYADPGEPDIPVVRLIQSIDAKAHRDLVEDDARHGDPDALRRLARTAAGKGKFGGAPGPVNRAKAVLAEIEAVNPNLLREFLNGVWP
jgi:predicted chitinase